MQNQLIRKLSLCSNFFTDYKSACEMAPLSGNGSERLVRYFYNSSTQECESFIYSGKGGNGNNFLSSTKCERTCKDGK